MATPTTRKKQLGHALRYLREQVSLGQERAGGEIRKPQNRIAEIENGTRNIAHGDLVLLLKLYGVTDDDQLAALTALREDNSQRGRWGGYRATYPDYFRTFVDLEEDADEIRTVHAEIVPGLLQCESYVRAVFADRPRDTGPRDTEGMIAARLARQAVFDRPNPPRFHAVLSESAVRRWQGGAEVMREQLRHLVTLSDRPNLRLQVLPFQTTDYSGASVSYQFTVLRVPSLGIGEPMRVVYVDQVLDVRYLEDKPALDLHDGLWHRLSSAALSPADTRAFLCGLVGPHR